VREQLARFQIDGAILDVEQQRVRVEYIREFADLDAFYVTRNGR